MMRRSKEWKTVERELDALGIQWNAVEGRYSVRNTPEPAGTAGSGGDGESGEPGEGGGESH